MVFSRKLRFLMAGLVKRAVLRLFFGELFLR